MSAPLINWTNEIRDRDFAVVFDGVLSRSRSPDDRDIPEADWFNRSRSWHIRSGLRRPFRLQRIAIPRSGVRLDYLAQQSGVGWNMDPRFIRSEGWAAIRACRTVCQGPARIYAFQKRSVW